MKKKWTPDSCFRFIGISRRKTSSSSCASGFRRRFRWKRSHQKANLCEGLLLTLGVVWNLSLNWQLVLETPWWHFGKTTSSWYSWARLSQRFFPQPYFRWKCCGSFLNVFWGTTHQLRSQRNPIWSLLKIREIKSVSN